MTGFPKNNADKNLRAMLGDPKLSKIYLFLDNVLKNLLSPFWDILYLNYSGHQDKKPFELACDKIHKILLLSGYYTIHIHVPGRVSAKHRYKLQDTEYEILFSPM